MKIIYLHQYFNTPSMQGSTRSYEMARRLVERGHSVVMVTSWREPRESRDWFVTEEDGIEVHWLPVPYGNNMSYRQRIHAFLRFALSAGRRAAAMSGDLVFATSTPLTIALPGVWAAKRGRRPMVFEVRDLWPEMPIAIGALRNPIAIWAARKLERFAYRHSEHIVTLSPGMSEGVIETGYPADRVSMVPNSADLDKFESSPDRAERFRSSHPELGSGPIVLYAGTLGRVNGVHYLAELAAAVVHTMPETRFVVLGSGSETERVRSRARELGVLDRNFFLYGQVPKSEVGDAFSAASMVTSLFEDIPEMEKNSANKFFDGLASGRAIGINYGGWQAELLQESRSGLRLARDTDVAAQQLSKFLIDADLVRSTGVRARHLAKSRFSRDELAGQLEASLLAAVNGR